MSTYRNCVVMMKKVKFLCLDSISGLITWLFPWDANWWGGRRLMIVFGNLPTPFTLWVKTMLSPSLELPHVWRPSVAGLNHLLLEEWTDFILNHFMYNNFSQITKIREWKTERSLFRKKRFALNEMFKWNASKFAIFYV